MGACIGQRLDEKGNPPDKYYYAKVNSLSQLLTLKTETKCTMRQSITSEEISQEIRPKKRLSGLFLSTIINKDQKKILQKVQ